MGFIKRVKSDICFRAWLGSWVMNHDWVGLSDLVQHANGLGKLQEQMRSLQASLKAECL